ncbi:hypothetical protein FPV67DRAFT_1651268 [Lyophyllum atratum]|nr:hypothetical protein FPV67DRAFT_1651268 [Lyophyllum atratum]
MHQEHNIPWNSLASNFRFIRDNARFTPRISGFFVRNLPTQAKTLNHFARVLSTTITTFAETERTKYNTSFDAPNSGKLFTDELRDRYPDYMNEKNQRIEHWIERATTSSYPPHNKYYDTSQADLAEVVKILINENQMPSTSSQLGTYFGFSRVAEAALHTYIFFNLCAATDTLRGGEYLEIPEYESMIREITYPMDYPAQQLPHRGFLSYLPKDPKSTLPEAHRDLPGLRDYMKRSFSLLYRYEMLVRECNLHLEWETLIAEVFEYWIRIRGVKIDCLVDEVDDEYLKRFT